MVDRAKGKSRPMAGKDGLSALAEASGGQRVEVWQAQSVDGPQRDQRTRLG